MIIYNTTTVFGKTKKEKEFRPLWCFFWKTEEEREHKINFCKEVCFKGYYLKFEDRVFNV